MSVEEKCSHEKVELLGEEKGEKGTNKYFRCQKCGNILILSEEGVLYEVLAADKQRLNRGKKLLLDLLFQACLLLSIGISLACARRC